MPVTVVCDIYRLFDGYAGHPTTVTHVCKELYAECGFSEVVPKELYAECGFSEVVPKEAVQAAMDAKLAQCLNQQSSKLRLS